MLDKISFHKHFNVKKSHPKFYKTTNFDRFDRGGKTKRFNRVLYNAIDNVFVVFPRVSLASCNSNSGSTQPLTQALCSLLPRTRNLGTRLGSTKDSIVLPGTNNVARNTANFWSTWFTHAGMVFYSHVRSSTNRKRFRFHALFTLYNMTFYRLKRKPFTCAKMNNLINVVNNLLQCCAALCQ